MRTTRFARRAEARAPRTQRTQAVASASPAPLTPGLPCAGDPPGNPGKTTASPDTANGPGTVAWVPDPMTMRPTTTTRRLTPPVTLEPTASEEPTANCEITHRARGAATPSLPPD